MTNSRCSWDITVSRAFFSQMIYYILVYRGVPHPYSRKKMADPSSNSRPLLGTMFESITEGAETYYLISR
jgi:hypothetical protein